MRADGNGKSVLHGTGFTKQSFGGTTRVVYTGAMKRIFVLCLLGLWGCAAQPTPMPTVAPTVFVNPTNTPAPTKTIVAPTATRLPVAMPTNMPATAVPETKTPDPVIVGAGDIAVCGATGDEATAQLIEKIDGLVFTLGDNVYPNGSAKQFQECYAPTWGKFKARTYPIPGNHDYNTGGAQAYYEYFGARAGEAGKGYYSFDVGAWHIVALNSEIETDENSAQVQWLRDDLAQHSAQCTLAMFHRPLFSSGPHGSDGSGIKTRVLWDVLYENNADVILNGHDHAYERFAPQNPNGERDDARGIRQFVVGTGGAVPYTFREIKPNSEKRIPMMFGVLQLTLHETSYDWKFIPVTGMFFADSGQGECH